MSTELDYTEKREIEDLLLGRRIVSTSLRSVDIPGHVGYRSIADGSLTLDDGTTLYLRGNSDCCAHYGLTKLATVDNIITAVRFEDDPDGADGMNRGPYGSADRERPGTYRIFVVADNVEINAVEFEGTDSNGYYGTGYYLWVVKP